MFQGCYQRILGLSEGLVAPDYYQLLGVERSWIDPQRITAVMERRIALLDSAKSDDSDLADYFRRELHRARAALTTESLRQDYDRRLLERRVNELGQYVQRMVDNGALTAAAEEAITNQANTFEIPVADAKAAIDAALQATGAARSEAGMDDAEALKAAGERLAAIMGEIEEARLKSEMGTGEVKEALTFDIPEGPALQPKGSPAAPAAAAAQASPARATDSIPMRSEPSRTAAMPVGLAPQMEKLRKEMRRMKGTLTTLCLIAGAFIVGDFIAIVFPDAAAWLGGTVSPSGTMSFGIIGAGLGVMAVLFLLAYWLSGFKRDGLYLAPALLAAVPALVGGLVPLGSERDAELAKSDLAKRAADLETQVTTLKASLKAAEKGSTDATAASAAATKRIQELQGELKAFKELSQQLTADRDQLRTKTAELSTAAVEALKQVTEKDKKIGELEAEVKEYEAVIIQWQEAVAALEKEVADLKRKLAEKSREPKRP